MMIYDVLLFVYCPRFVPTMSPPSSALFLLAPPLTYLRTSGSAFQRVLCLAGGVLGAADP